MMAFKILADNLPAKWQTELRQILKLNPPAAAKGGKTAPPATALTVDAGGLEIVDALVDWIRQMNRKQNTGKNFAGQGISLKIEKPDGSHIALSERNAAVVKQFLAK